MIISIAKAARILGLTRQAVWYRIKTGKIRAFRVGKAYLVNDEKITTLLPKNNNNHQSKKESNHE